MNNCADKLFLRCYVARIIYRDAEIRYIIWGYIPWFSALQVLTGYWKSQISETQNKPIYISVSKVGHTQYQYNSNQKLSKYIRPNSRSNACTSPLQERNSSPEVLSIHNWHRGCCDIASSSPTLPLTAGIHPLVVVFVLSLRSATLWYRNSKFSSAISKRTVPSFIYLFIIHYLETKLRGLSPRANYTDRATADCRRS
jgi:hypothetical protein